MEYRKIANLLGNIPDKVPRFITNRWMKVHDQSRGSYNTNKQIRFKKSMLQSDLCDHSNAYVAVKGIITIEEVDNRDRKNRDFILKSNAPLISCISKINNKLSHNAEDLDVVIPVYNLLQYCKHCSKTSGSLWNYYRDELTDEEPNANGPNKHVVESKFFKYKTSITGSIMYNV